jgi:hypothetical protein
MRGIKGSLVAITVLMLGPGLAWAQGYIYPAKGQSAEQQQKDQSECHAWAIQQPGANAMAVPPPPDPRSGQVVGGAARGAAIGAVGGAIGGDAGKGAAIGAASGALIGGMRRNQQASAAQQAQAQATTAYNRALAACLEGRGYTIK